MAVETLHILVVDDSEPYARLLQDVLELRSGRVEVAVERSLAGARRCLNTLAPDLVISEWLLPDGKGDELLPSGPGEAAYPVIIMTGCGDERAAVESIRAGALNYIVKSDESLSEMPCIVEKSLDEWAGLVERRRADQALRESEEQFRSFFDSAGAGMAIIGLDGKVLKINPTFCRISGYREDEALEKNVLEVTHPDDREKTKQLYDEIRSGRRKSYVYEKCYLAKDGSAVWGRATVAGVYDSAGRLNCFAATVQNITERKQAEKALTLSEERFRTFFNSAAAGMVNISPEGTFLETNEAFCRFVGYSCDELASLRVAEITHPDDLAKTAEKHRLLASGRRQSIHYRKRFLRKGGEVVWGHVSVAAVSADGNPQYYVGLVQDITGAKRVQDQIRESKQMLQLVLDYIPQYVFWKDRDSVYRGCNRNFARGAGVGRPQDLVGKTDFELPWTREEAEFYRECDRRVMAADLPELHIIETQLQADGKRAWLDTNKIPLHDAEGQVVGILGTFEDISARKRAEDELVETNRELDAFVCTVSHDLRTPLTPIISYAEILQETYRDRLDEQALECLANIETQGRRMLAVMEDLLLLAKVGHLERPTEPVDPNTVLDDVLVGMGERIMASGVMVERTQLPVLRVPETLLAQLFDNLIGNAVRYAGSDGSPILIEGQRRGHLVRFSVQDQGPGIPEEERRQIFELFSRGAAGRGSVGTGVGLAIVQKISRLFGGRAWVEETPGGGSTFVVELTDS